jgi:hypothetical protein
VRTSSPTMTPTLVFPSFFTGNFFVYKYMCWFVGDHFQITILNYIKSSLIMFVCVK